MDILHTHWLNLEWRRRARCLEADPELFFPIGSSGPAMQQIEEAKFVCRACDVARDCLEWALSIGETEGVWGGMSPDERRRLAQSRHPAVQALRA